MYPGYITLLIFVVLYEKHRLYTALSFNIHHRNLAVFYTHSIFVATNSKQFDVYITLTQYLLMNIEVKGKEIKIAEIRRNITK